MAGRRANGSGTIGRLPDGRWQGRYTAHDGDGRPLRRAVYGKTRREAEDRLIDALRDRNHQAITFSRGRGPTLATYLEGWLAGAAVRCRPRTVERYRGLLRQHVIPALGGVPIARLEVRQVNALLASKLAEGHAPRSVHHLRAVLRAALSAAVREGVLTRNVAALADPPRVPEREPTVLTASQARRLIAATATERDGPLWVLALATGARQGELLGLRWDDFDPEHGELRISRTLQRVRGAWVVGEPKTSRSRRTLLLPPVAIAALARQRAQQLTDRLSAGPGWQDTDGLIFTTATGAPREGTHATKVFQRTCVAIGLPPVRFHDLRHTTATVLAAAGIPVRDVQDQLGHSTVLTTLGTYIHVVPEARRAVADTLDAVLGGPTSPSA
ncbi:MAG: tyrosine-type recombinase/integrase [Candidatus Dormibacteria bacterium]